MAADEMCEYCHRGDVILYAAHADVWCADCLRREIAVNPRFRIDGDLKDAPMGRPRDAEYHIPFIFQTPDGQVIDGKRVKNSMNETLKTGYEWAIELHAQILDPDGWRNAGKSMSEPITKAEFDLYLNQSTINSEGYPTFAGGATFTARV